MKFSEKWGKDVDDAVRLALQDLKLGRDQVEVIVLEEPSKGFFGIGSKLAKVRVQKIEVEPDPEPEVLKNKEANEADSVKKAPRSSKKQQPKDNTTKDKKQRSRRKDTGKANLSIRKRPEGLSEVQDAPGLDFLKDITDKMGLKVSIKAFASENSLFFEITGSDSGTIIGKRGQTLDSIQYLTSLVANKGKEKYLRVIVDAENYRAKRERTLEQLANRLGEKVVKTGKSVRLEPMNPYERKVIHATLQKNTSVNTRSEGEEPYRRIVIEKK